MENISVASKVGQIHVAMVLAYQLAKLTRAVNSISMACKAVQLPEVDGISMPGSETGQRRRKYLNRE